MNPFLKLVTLYEVFYKKIKWPMPNENISALALLLSLGASSFLGKSCIDSSGPSAQERAAQPSPLCFLNSGPYAAHVSYEQDYEWGFLKGLSGGLTLVVVKRPLTLLEQSWANRERF